MSTPSFLWHDYETFGINPKLDRPAQFAAIRTDAELNEIESPIELFCQLSNDYLPDPVSMALTGITPEIVAERGIPEPEFVKHIHEALSRPGTCGVGYNTLRFDDELTRHLFWRNLYPPYDREWRNQCGRWDILDLVRACHAFRPEGIEWPLREDGLPSFKLEHLSAANGLSHEHAHDAVSDVRATIALARLIKQKQPRLFEHCLKMRNKQTVLAEIAKSEGRAFLHVSGMFGAAKANIALVTALGWHPDNRNQLIVWDLAYDPLALFELTTEQVRQRMFTPAEQLPRDVARLPIKTIHINRSPIVVGDLRVLSGTRAEQLGIDLAQAEKHLANLQKAPAPMFSWHDIFKSESIKLPKDVDGALYDGFIQDGDRRRLDQLRTYSSQQLASAHATFDDPRLPDLLMRYRARNWPDTLSQDEQHWWQTHREERLSGLVPGVLGLGAFKHKLAELLNNGSLTSLEVTRLSNWAEQHCSGLNMSE
ncbi:exodeoxyribonuclease I [Burkholderiaceae bacterium DAT-1]|nr:exodeoxyribonuclease I [Burkholderiaceae bacterium DAT-1]